MTDDTSTDTTVLGQASASFYLPLVRAKVIIGPLQDNFTSFERESSLLREVDIDSVQCYRVMYPVDAVSDKEARKWFPQAFQLVDVDLGPHYAEFLGYWFQFERLHSWNKSGGRLASFGRPTLISTWIKEGRYPPRCTEPLVGVDGLEQYSRELVAWWRSMRPKTAFNREVVGSDWVALDKYGINGWLSIVVGMKWWGKCLHFAIGDGLKAPTEEWISMLKDLNQIIKDLLTYLDGKQ